MVPYHLVGKQILKEAVFGGYIAHVGQLHPDAPPPAVLIERPKINCFRPGMGTSLCPAARGAGTGPGQARFGPPVDPA